MTDPSPVDFAETIEITFNPLTKSTLTLLELFDEAGLAYARTDCEVEHYDGFGGHHEATILSISLALFVACLKQICTLIIAHKGRRDLRVTIKTKAETIHFQVRNAAELESAVKLTAKLRSTGPNRAARRPSGKQKGQ